MLAPSAGLIGQQTMPAGWTPELAMKVKSVGAVRVASEGRKVVYTVSQAVMTPDKSEFVTQIWCPPTYAAWAKRAEHGLESETDKS